MVAWRNAKALLGLDDLAEPATKDDGTVDSSALGQYTPPDLNLVDGACIDLPLIELDPLTGINISAVKTTLQSVKILPKEREEVLSSYSAASTHARSAQLEAMASVISILPNFEGAVKPMGAGAAIHFGGVQLSAAITTIACVMSASASALHDEIRQQPRAL